MEIDFTKKDDDSLSNDSSYDPKHSSCYDLMEIEYPQNANSMCNQAEIGKRKKSASISGTSVLKESATRVSQPVPIARRSDGPDSDGYMSMKPVGSSDSKHSINSLTFQRGVSSSSISSSPTKYASSRTASISSPGATHRNIPVSRTHQNSISTDDYLNMSPVNVRSSTIPKVSSQSSQLQQLQQQQQPLPQQQQQQSTNMHHVGSGSAPDGYMEMSWNNRTTASNNSNNLNNNNNGHVTLERNRQSSSSLSSSNEYIHMNYSGNIPRTSSASSDCSSTSSIEISTHAIESRNSRMRSLPITIKKSQQSQPTNATISKQTCGTQPHNHPYHSFAASKMVPPTYLSLNTNIKPTSAQTPSDSTSECSITTPTGDITPHNASTIFPFSPNSPNSGMNKQIFSSQSMQLPCEEQKRKCLVDGTTGKYFVPLNITLNFISHCSFIG